MRVFAPQVMMRVRVRIGVKVRVRVRMRVRVRARAQIQGQGQGLHLQPHLHFIDLEQCVRHQSFSQCVVARSRLAHASSTCTTHLVGATDTEP